MPTNAERLARIIERYGPDRGPVVEPPTIEDVRVLLRLHSESEQRAADVERRIVAWLRKGRYRHFRDNEAFQFVADTIERGEHNK